MAIVIFTGICIVNNYVPLEYNNLFSLWVIKQYWLFFVAAYFARKYNLMSLLAKRNLLFSLSLIGYVIGFLLYIHGNPHLFYLNAFFFITAIFYVFMMMEKSNNVATRALSYLGKNTLEIYIFHFFIIQMTSLEVVGIWFAESGNVFLEVFTGIVYSVIVAYICIWFGKLLHLSELINNVLFGAFTKRL